MLYKKAMIHTPTEITLAPRQLWSIQGNRRDMIRCTRGRLWITQEADYNDYIVEAGKDFWVTKLGSIVVQALDDARFKYCRTKLGMHIGDAKQPANVQRIRA